jgi:hypothetical protein
MGSGTDGGCAGGDVGDHRREHAEAGSTTQIDFGGGENPFALLISSPYTRIDIGVQLVLAMFHGTWIFAHEPAYGWYLSVTAIGLNISWSLHNVIAWMKNRPFLSRRVSIFYITTVILVQPYWVLEIYANFTYFNNINKIFLKTRPLEPLFR